MPTTTPTRVCFAKQDLEIPSPALGEMSDASHLLGNPGALRERLAEDGFLLIRGLHDPAAVLAARRGILDKVAAQGRLDPAAPLMQAKIGSQAKGAFFGKAKDDEVKSTPAYQDLVRSPRLMGFFDRLFSAQSMTFDFQWLRLVGHGDFTGAHLDNVYMGRGSPNLLTVWTPLGDVTYDRGPLAIAAGSHRQEEFAKIRATYGQMDVDRDRVAGAFSDNPREISERYNARWLTSEFRAGDALIFGMYTLHASLTNTSDCFRLSSDTRYQPAHEPADERWIGPNPKAHYGWHAGPQVPMADKRKEWGV